MRHTRFMRAWLEKSFAIVKLWESWGIPMKYQGPIRVRWAMGFQIVCLHLKYSGKDQKITLTRRP
jgi:hypothetical protein